MKAGCQTGLEEQHLPWGERRVMFAKGESCLRANAGRWAAGQALPSQQPHKRARAHYNLWHCLSWAVSLSSSLSFFPLLPIVSRGSGVLLSLCLYPAGSSHLPAAPH